MLIIDMRIIGNKLLVIRKRLGLTQDEVAERSNIALRTYADIERGSVNMRIETILKICSALGITPDDILTQNDSDLTARQEEVWGRLNSCTPKERATALHILSAYLESLRKE